MNSCFLITSYCDTEEKLNVLSATIQDLKKYGLDICVHAHFPLPFEIQQSVNYYIFDKSNPIIPYDVRSIIMWRKIDNLQLNILKRDYGYTVMNQIKGGSLFLHNLNYDIIHILNYDTIVTDSLLENSKNIERFSGIFYLNKKEETNLLFMTLKLSDYIEDIKSITMQDYISMNEYWYAEGYIFHKLNKNNLYLDDLVSHKGIRHQPFEFLKFDYDKFSVHIGEKIVWKDDKVYTDKTSIYFYNLRDTIDFKIFLGFNLYYHNTINENTLIDTNLDVNDMKKHFGYYLNDEFIEGDNYIKILVNDKELKKEILNSICLCAIEQRNE